MLLLLLLLLLLVLLMVWLLVLMWLLMLVRMLLLVVWVGVWVVVDLMACRGMCLASATQAPALDHTDQLCVAANSEVAQTAVLQLPAIRVIAKLQGCCSCCSSPDVPKPWDISWRQICKAEGPLAPKPPRAAGEASTVRGTGPCSSPFAPGWTSAPS